MHASFPSQSDVRAHAVVLGLCLLLAITINLTTPGLRDRTGQIKGSDFANFYALGSLALSDHHEWLYDRAGLAAYSVGLLPDLGETYYLPIYGPQVALFFAPLAQLPYALALVLWVAATTAMFAACCWLFWRTSVNLSRHAVTVAIAAAASPAFFNLVMHGQNSALALLCFTGGFFALRRNRMFLAGLAIGSLAFKPQLGLVIACVFLLNREWRVVSGAIVGAALQLGLAWLYFGSDVMIAYANWLQGVGEINSLLAIKPYQMHSIYAFLKMLIPSAPVAMALYAIAAVVCVGASYLVWRGPAPLSLRFAFVLLTTALASPHLYVYDLVILAPAFLIVADYTLAHPDDIRSKRMQKALYFAYLLPLAGLVAQVTHVQLSVVAMAALTVALFSVGRRQLDDDVAAVSALDPVAP
jgi:hypothetical protein